MTAIGDLVVHLSANRERFSRELGHARADLKGFSEFAKKQGGAGGLLNPPIGGLPLGPLAGIFAAKKMLDSAGSMLSLYQVQEQAERKLEAVIRATGGAAGLSAQEIKTYAGELQNLTNFGDEATIAAAGVLATFKEIKGATFKEALASAQDLSSVMGQDLQSSVVQIGKALNDPIKGVTALQRVGVSFTQAQKDQIKTLQQSGDLLGAQGIILRELRSEFGGAAQAMADPITQAKNAAGDLGEAIGGRLAPYVKLGAAALRDFAAAGAEATKAGYLTQSQLAQMSLGSRITSFDWWAQGGADLVHLGGMAVDAVGAIGSSISGALVHDTKAADAAWAALYRKFVDPTPSETLEQQAQKTRDIAAATQHAGDAAGELVDHYAKLGSAVQGWQEKQAALYGRAVTGEAQGAQATAREGVIGDLLQKRDSLLNLSPRQQLGMMMQSGMLPEQAAQMETLVTQIEGLEAAKRSQQFVDGLTSKIIDLRDATAGWTDGQRLLFDAQRMGLTPDTLRQVEAMAREMDRLNAVREESERLTRMEDHAQRLTEGLRTHAEEVRDAGAEYGEMLARGMIDDATYDQAIQALIDQGRKSSRGSGLAGAARQGSSEAWGAIMAAMNRKEDATQQKQQTEYLRQIAESARAAREDEVLRITGG